MLASAVRPSLRCISVAGPIHHVRNASNSALLQLSTPKTKDFSNRVWKFKSDPANEQKKHAVAARKGGKARLDTLSSDSDSFFPLCLEAAAKMKLEGVRPDLQIYHALMDSAAVAGAWLQAWAILDDMLLVGVQPDITLFNHLIRVSFFDIKFIYHMLTRRYHRHIVIDHPCSCGEFLTR